MTLIDTHSHIYDEVFDTDIDAVLASARNAGVERIMLPAIDSLTHQRMFDLSRRSDGYALPMIGLHPTSVNENPDFEKELELVEQYLENPMETAGIERFYGIGEIGLDLYWSKDFIDEQMRALRFQIELSLRHNLPVVIHTREAWAEMLKILNEFRGRGLRGIMHSFSGTVQDYHSVLECGDFMFGIGGPVTYKKTALTEILPQIGLERLVLETDSPYLTPVPFRGKRNESAYLPYICTRVAEILHTSPEHVAEITTQNAKKIFGLL